MVSSEYTNLGGFTMNKKMTQRKSLGILQFQNLSVHLLSKQPIKLQVFKRQVKEGRVGHVKF